jgi:hypothetical protein
MPEKDYTAYVSQFKAVVSSDPATIKSPDALELPNQVCWLWDVHSISH